MTKLTMSRRTLLSGAAALSAAVLAPNLAFAAQDDQTDITVSNGRVVTYSIWRPATVRAAIVFSHGAGGRPQNYEALTSTYRDAGILIAAPLHVDSHEHPHRADYDRTTGFRARCEDMVAGFGLLNSLAADAPKAVSGHSYGALMSLITAGGCQPAIPEPLAPVGILTGRLALDAGHLFACESPGLNGEGGLLDLPLTAPASAKHHRMRFNEYCRGVAADGERLFLAVDRSFKTDIVDGRPVAYEKGVVLASVPRSADPPWAAGAGPGTLVATEVKSVRDFFVRGGEVTLVADDVALGFTRDGKRAGEFRWGTYGLAAPLGDAGWVWSKDSSAGKDSGRVCTGGRLYAGGSASAGREVTQAVCYAKAFATTATDLLWVDAAYITPGGAGDTTRYRVKRVARPAP